MRLVLASQSAARRALLAGAGVAYETASAAIDEEAAKAALRADGFAPRALADALAELKARQLSGRLGGAIVLGCDQVLALDDGDTLDKAATREEAAAQLRRLRGRRHQLMSAVVACEEGVPVWRAVETATLHVRDFSDAFLDSYLDAEWPAVAGCVGGYRIEGLGAQLFARVEGSHAAILGLPLLPLLAWLRDRGLIAR